MRRREGGNRGEGKVVFAAGCFGDGLAFWLWFWFKVIPALRDGDVYRLTGRDVSE